MPLTATSIAPAPAARAAGYWILLAWSLGLTLLTAGGLLVAGHWDVSGVNRVRDILGYGHFTLAYLFTWPLVRRQLGSLAAALGYVALFLVVIAVYVALQRWLSASLNFLFLIALFMTHHASNEILFRQQTGNGYQRVPWTARRMWWVALVVGLVFVDRLGSDAHPWHGAQRAIALAWAAAWLGYGWRYVLRAMMTALTWLGWISAGLTGAWCTVHPTAALLFTSQFRFGWIIIYHYLAWYVFYTRKLLYRNGGWSPAWPAPRSLAALWRGATTIPIGFLALVILGNAAIVGLCLVGDPVARDLNAATGLNFFAINTVAHILFGVGLPPTRTAGSAPVTQQVHEPLSQFA